MTWRSEEGRRRRRGSPGDLAYLNKVKPYKPGSEGGTGAGLAGGSDAGHQTLPLPVLQKDSGPRGISRDGPGEPNMTAGPVSDALPSAGSCFD